MSRRIIALGAIGLALAVIAGAFSAHALKGILEPRLFEVFNTAVDYQIYHSLGLVLIGTLSSMTPDNRSLHRAAYTMLAGMVLFSGSLYLLVATGVNAWGMVTPFGGVLFIVAWVILAWSQLRRA